MAASRKGSISLLITGDEESVAVNGTVKLLQWAAARGETFDHCILGEPSNVEVLGDTIKAGRRGSLNGTLIVTAARAMSPIPTAPTIRSAAWSTLIAALQAPLDQGSAHFDPSNLEFTSVDVGNPTVNLIPGEARARFNIRYNDRHSQAALKDADRAARASRRRRARALCHRLAAVERRCLRHQARGRSPILAVAAIAEVTGRKPKLSTTGGTSDARFIKDYCPVLEFGLVGQTMHQVDECAPVADLVTLTAIYRRIIEKYFG
jgi:succinyl-diaminopimelate desuccinylase